MTTTDPSMPVIRVVVEQGAKRTFASAVDFPGWSRSAKRELDAIDALLEYRPRFLVAAERAGVAVPSGATIEVIERVSGNATTDFGAPAIPAAVEIVPSDVTTRARAAALVSAAWGVFDAVEAAAPRVLRKGPRGGGRDTDAIRAHLLDAEQAYKGKLGVRGTTDIAVVRSAVLHAILDGRAPTKPTEWPTAYAARRFAWHALDHAWEIEDRSAR